MVLDAQEWLDCPVYAEEVDAYIAPMHDKWEDWVYAAPIMGDKGHCNVALVPLRVAPSPELVKEFEELAERWFKETSLSSSVSKRAIHPAYQRIIGMGPLAIPLILKALERTPDHWFWALWAITGQDPTPEDGNFNEARSAWLNWGRQEGYI